MRHRYLLAVAAVALTAACNAQPDPGQAGAGAAGPSSTAAESASGQEAALLAEHGLDGMAPQQIVDALEDSTDPRPLALGASVKPDELLLSDEDQEVALALPDDSFYVSVAPFVDSTHECYFHSLATCQGELAEQDMQVTITDDSGEVLVDEQVTTGTNGFTGFWLPRDITGTIEVQYEDYLGEVDFATDEDSPTCVTTLQLAA